jgi:hypothetical protein
MYALTVSPSRLLQHRRQCLVPHARVECLARCDLLGSRTDVGKVSLHINYPSIKNLNLGCSNFGSMEPPNGPGLNEILTKGLLPFL